MSIAEKKKAFLNLYSEVDFNQEVELITSSSIDSYGNVTANSELVLENHSSKIISFNSPRGGVGSLDYAVEGTKFKDTFVKGDQLFRVSGGETFQEGNWSFTQNPGNQINTIRKGHSRLGI